MLFKQRKQMEAMIAAEAAGQSFWTDQFDTPVRVKVELLLVDCLGQDAAYDVVVAARELILRAEGRHNLQRVTAQPYQDFIEYFIACPSYDVASCIEALRAAVHAYQEEDSYRPYFMAYTVPFEEGVKKILREARISYDLVEGQMVEFSSQELVTEVVSPTLRLLSGRTGFQKVEAAYQYALKELADGRPDNAITDVGTALQELLLSLDCQGNSLGPLIKSARSKGLFGPHDSKMTDALKDIAEWVSADRSQTGDTHKVTEATIEDAWLTIHVVGALILRLSNGEARNGS